MTGNMQIFTIGRSILGSYFLMWLWLLYQNVGSVTEAQLQEIFLNALILSAFMGLALNINAFHIRNQQQQFRTLLERLQYVKSHLGSIATFFITPFCVSSASGLAVANEQQSLIYAAFGTDNYFLVMLLGFVFLILLPSIYIYFRHG